MIPGEVEGDEVESEDDREPLEDRPEELDSVHLASVGGACAACYLPQRERADEKRGLS